MNFNQSPYELQHGKYVAGMVADGELNNTVSKVNKSAQTIQYGRFVSRSGDDGVVPVSGTDNAGNIVGVVRYELNRAQGLNGDVTGVPVDRDGSILTMGAVAVESITNAVAGAPVFVVIGDGSNAANLGKVANVAGTAANTAVALPNAIYAEAATAGKLVKISIKVGG